MCVLTECLLKVLHSDLEAMEGSDVHSMDSIPGALTRKSTAACLVELVPSTLLVSKEGTAGVCCNQSYP